jgi:hypothetical protein
MLTLTVTKKLSSEKLPKVESGNKTTSQQRVRKYRRLISKKFSKK